MDKFQTSGTKDYKNLKEASELLETMDEREFNEMRIINFPDKTNTKRPLCEFKKLRLLFTRFRVHAYIFIEFLSFPK